MSAPTKESRRSPINSQSESQSNPLDNSSVYNPYFLPAPTNAPPSRRYPISSINDQRATSYPLELQSNPFDGSSNFDPYSFPAPTSVPGPMSGPIMSNTHDSISPMNLIGTQNHNIPEEMTGYEGTAAPLQQQIYENPQPTVFNEELFRCNQCHQIYSRGYDLTRHKWSHMPIHCDECGHGFNRTYDLDRHKNVHYAQRLYTCEICGRGFERVAGLQVHICENTCFKSGSLPGNRYREDKTGPQTKGGPSHNDHPYSL